MIQLSNNENFYRKVAFGLKPEEKAPSDPLTWAQKQVETIPELNWKGKHIYSEKEMRKYWITQRVEENTTLRKKYKNDPQGLKRKEMYEGRDLNATIDARSVYASAMSTVFDLDFKRIQKDVFWGEDLQNLSDKLFKA